MSSLLEQRHGAKLDDRKGYRFPGAPHRLPIKGWLPDLLTRVAVASGIGYLAAAYAVSRWLTRPTRRRPTQTPEDHGFAYEPLECRTDDAIRLVGWVVSPPRPRATLALFHGMRQSRQQTLLRSVFLATHGYRCVAFDHRAHGQSKGKRTSFGYHERRDVAAIVELIERRWPAQPRAALGISMGAAALCYAARDLRGLSAVILESLYHDIGSTFANRIGAEYPAWFQRLSQGVVWMTQRRLGIRLEQLAPVDHVDDLAPVPVLFITGTEDCHAPPEDSERLYQRYRGPRELCLVPQAGHIDLFEAGGPLYQQRVKGFLDRWLA